MDDVGAAHAGAPLPGHIGRAGGGALQYGQFDEAIRYAHRYLAVDRLDESIHQHLISLHIAAGDRAAALQQYRQCVKLLEQELGVSPLPETRALYESALAGDTPRQNLHAPPAHWSTLPGPRVPLVGREQAWESLNHLYARASTGRGCVAMVTGEAGSGKSRLLEQFAMQSPARAAGGGGAAGLPVAAILPADSGHPTPVAHRRTVRASAQ